MTAAPRDRRQSSPAGNSGGQRTIRAMVATALGLVPLVALFTDVRWLVQACAAVVIVSGTAAMMRYWYRPRSWQPVLGTVLLVPWLTWRFAPDHAFGGVIPSRASLRDMSDLLTQVRHTTSSAVAPVHADHSITFVLAAVAGLLALFTDIVAVVGRRPALAGVPFLVIFTVSGAVTRHPVSWILFAVAAAGFLLLLSVDARDEVHDWGRIIPRQGETRTSAALGVSGPRIAAVAIVVAVLIPFAVPSRTSNLIANAFHSSGSSDRGTAGIGTGGVSLDPFAALSGELQRTKPVDLFSVSVDQSSAMPYYLRANVLATFTNSGWTVDTHGAQESVSTTSFDTDPSTADQSSTSFTALITVIGLSDNPPVFARPIQLRGVDASTAWSRGDQLLVGSTVRRGEVISELVGQPNPSIADLTASSGAYPDSVRPDEQVPAGIPRTVRNLVAQITAGATSAYGRARALSDFFTQPANGFTYNLQTKAGDSGSALVDFLTNRVGFCQQYAAAMGIMLRIAGIPSRVVLGYTHPPPDQTGTFTVTSSNAHAWDEAFFAGVGWIPFDPTPITVEPGGATTDLLWAPHPAAGANPLDTLPNPHQTSSVPTSAPAKAQSGGANAHFAKSDAQTMPWSLVWTLVAALALGALAAAPGTIRWRRRRRRLRAARRGDPDPLWTELSDTATDLGYVWSSARTPRQVAGWLTAEVGSAAALSLQTLAAAVEHARYAPDGLETAPPAPVALLKDVEAHLRSHRSAAARLRSRVLPASVRWGPRSQAGRHQ
ncbi:MAG: DUF3488 and transglutaminase-like domain-containing protein [Actinomycetota bacterium]|nr:DUF3488 and transglutaminase-like domain-containing protein [Actinomycetota bacterium]